MEKYINRLKVVLAEKKKQISGWQSSWGVRLPQCLSGLPMRASLLWKIISV